MLILGFDYIPYRGFTYYGLLFSADLFCLFLNELKCGSTMVVAPKEHQRRVP